jgi:hypothetical protein
MDIFNSQSTTPLPAPTPLGLSSLGLPTPLPAPAPAPLGLPRPAPLPAPAPLGLPRPAPLELPRLAPLGLPVPAQNRNNSEQTLFSLLGISESETVRIAGELERLRPATFGPRMTYDEFMRLPLEEKRALTGRVTIGSSEPYDIILEELILLNNSLKIMDNTNVRELYNDIRREQTSTPIIEFTIYRTPASDRLIANVTRLIWNGVDLLSGDPIMLYESSGESRGTGLGGIWLPYMGESFDRIVKLEDEYIKALDGVITHNSIDHYRTLLIDIIRNITSYKYYKRFINKAHLVASFLLNLKYQEYLSNPANQEHIRKYLRTYTNEEKQNAKRHLMIKNVQNAQINPQNYYTPITTELIDEIIQPFPQSGAGNKYYEKYLKYKNKYAMLKNFVLQH